MTLETLLTDTLPRETSGSRAANRLSYQKSWALCHIIDLHRSGSDYVIIFELHDDVLVLDSSVSPSKVTFHQVKTKKSGPWTRDSLTKREKLKKGQALSVLGKLTLNKVLFSNHVASLNLVSNQAYKLVLKSGKKQESHEICLEALHEDELRGILDALREEHSLKEDLDCVECTHLRTTTLSIGGHSTHALGALTSYLDEIYPNRKIAATPAFRSICDEIRRKTDTEQTPANFEELKSLKGITRSDFESILAEVATGEDFAERVNEICNDLAHEGASWVDRRSVRAACRRYEVERMDQSNLVVQRLRATVERVVAGWNAGSTLTLMQTAEALMTRLGPAGALAADVRGRSYVLASILVALYEQR